MIDSATPLHAVTSPGRRRGVTAGPPLLLALAVAAACAILATGPDLPLGPMYWDLYQYVDAAHRIAIGQVPVRDFFLPVGPLGYYLFAGALTLFPHGSVVLLAQWSMLAVTAPLMALVGWDVAKRSPAVAYALVVPYLFFALLPLNTREYYPFPGVDGFGTYNRHGCELLYVLMAAIMFVRNRRLLTVVVAAVLPALFFLKMPGFLAGVLLSTYAVLSGRLAIRQALAVTATLAALLAVVQISSGVVGDYLVDVMALVGINSALLAPRFLQAASLNFGIAVAGGLLAVALLSADRRMLRSVARSAVELRSGVRASVVLDHVGMWLLVVLAAGLFNETQNLGSQALIFIWPVCLRVFLRVRRTPRGSVALITVLTLLAATVLPPVVNTFDRAGRAIAGSAKNVVLDSHNLKQLGAVSMRPEVAARVDDMLSFYPKHRETFDDMVADGNEATPLLYSDIDFQALYLMNVDRAVDAIRRLEEAKGIRFDTVMSLSNYNPFPYLLDRNAPRHVPIAADPLRTVPTPGPAEEAAIANTDLLLYPTCPPTVMDEKLLALYAAALKNHRRMKLTDCYDAFVRQGLTSQPGR
jgi:hypothetical protein